MHWMQRKKQQLPAKYHLWKNQDKWAKLVKNCKKLLFLLSFLGFFRNGTLQRGGVFCVAFSLSKPLFRAIKINNLTFFLIFHPKGGPFWCRGGKILPTWLKIVEILKLKQFWNQCDKWYNLAACILVGCDQGGYKNHPSSAVTNELQSLMQLPGCTAVSSAVDSGHIYVMDVCHVSGHA